MKWLEYNSANIYGLWSRLQNPLRPHCVFDIQCSKTCGRGSRSRESYCMNNLGRRLVDRECNEFQRTVTETCNDQPCPKWTVSEWSEVGLYTQLHLQTRLHADLKCLISNALSHRLYVKMEITKG